MKTAKNFRPIGERLCPKGLPRSTFVSDPLTLMELHRQNGVMESPRVKALRPAHKLVAGSSYVLFLHQGVLRPDEFVFEAENGFVSPKEFEKVVRNLPRFKGRPEASHAFETK